MLQPGRLREGAVDLVFTLPFVVLFLIQLAHHEMWRDEVNVFAIGQVSPTLGSLLYHVHYEGHPWLWYTLVWLLTRVTSSVFAIKLLAAVAGTAIYLLIGMVSPFRWQEKLLLFCSYYILFEYAVFARMYGPQLVFVLLYLWQRQRNPGRVLQNSTLLGIVASFDMTGLILAFALACEYLWTLLRTREIPGVSARRVAAGAAVLLVLTVISVGTLYPTHDVSVAPTKFTMRGNLFFLLAALMDYIARPYLATLRDQHSPFWNPEFGNLVFVHLLGVPLVLWAYWMIFKRHKRLLFILGATIVLSIAFAVSFYLGFTRHFGVSFVAFLCCLWMLKASGERVRWPAYALLVLLAIGGIDADVQSWRAPFSNARPAAAYLEDKRLMSLPWAGFQDFSVATLSTYTGHPVFQLNCLCVESFFFLSRKRDVFDHARIADGIRAAQHFFKAPEILYIGDVPLEPGQSRELAMKGYDVELIRHFEGATESLENYWIYDVREQKKPPVAK